MTIKMPQDVQWVLEQLHKGGFEAYIVGGCVRDAALNRIPNDYDITTSALPEEVKAIFPRTIDTGIEHGTVSVMVRDTAYEVTTYRVDGKYEDHRRPSKVEFTRTLKEDLLRRDFTINAMAYSHESGIVDLYGGLEDLEKGLIRCVGNPLERFNEDALRMLRAIRFSAKLEFEISRDTYNAIVELAPLIEHISAERIREELSKTLMTNQPWKMKLMVESGLIEYVIPEFLGIVHLSQNNPYHYLDVDEHTYESLKYIPKVQHLRWVMYFHDIGKSVTKSVNKDGYECFYGHNSKSAEITAKIMKRLKFDNKTSSIVKHLIAYHDYPIHVNKKAVRKAVSKIGPEYFDDIMLIKYADMMAHSDYKRAEVLEHLKNIETYYQEIINDDECLTIKDLDINGNDIIQVGITDGKQIGSILKKLLEYVLEHPEYNKKVILLRQVRNWK